MFAGLFNVFYKRAKDKFRIAGVGEQALRFSKQIISSNNGRAYLTQFRFLTTLAVAGYNHVSGPR